MQNIEIIKVNDSVTEGKIAEHEATILNEEASDLMAEGLAKPIKFRCAYTSHDTMFVHNVRQKLGNETLENFRLCFHAFRHTS